MAEDILSIELGGKNLNPIQREIERIKKLDITESEKRKVIREWRWELIKRKIVTSDFLTMLISILVSTVTALIVNGLLLLAIQ